MIQKARQVCFYSKLVVKFQVGSVLLIPLKINIIIFLPIAQHKHLVFVHLRRLTDFFNSGLPVAYLVYKGLVAREISWSMKQNPGNLALCFISHTPGGSCNRLGQYSCLKCKVNFLYFSIENMTFYFFSGKILIIIFLIEYSQLPYRLFFY